MIAYIESNYILEIVRQQETAQAAEQLLVLVVPSFAFVEPYWTLTKDGQIRDRAITVLQQQVDQLNRFSTRQSLAALLSNGSEQMRQVEVVELNFLETTNRRLLQTATIADVSGIIIVQALDYVQIRKFEAVQDAVMYAAIIADLQRQPQAEPKCFLNRNTKDFYTPEIKAELQTYKCRVIGDFENGLRYVQSHIENA